MRSYPRWVIGCLVALAFFAPLKFGAPVVGQSLIVPPQSAFEWLFFTWPNQIAYLFIFAALAWFVVDSNRRAARVDLAFVLPLLFLGTQAVASFWSINREVSDDTLLHFACCVLVFYVAAWYVRDGAAAMRIMGGLGLATGLVAVVALNQRFGGLQETREFAASAVDPATASPDLLLRLTSNRIFGTLVSPNSLAGFLVLAFAPTLAWIWVRGRGWDPKVKWATLLFAGGLMTFCLVLTGSRGGFMAFVAMIMAGLFCTLPSGWRRAVWVAGVCLGLLLVVVVAYRTGVIHLGSESVDARRDYWKGAIAIARDHPLVGTGPGTFGSIYPMYKVATTEEARLVHNNFLQMWSDSGMLAFLVFAGLWLVALRDSFALSRLRVGDAATVAIAAALTGWVVHSVVDFDLYIPGLAIPAFLLLGSLQGLKDIPQLAPVTPHGRTKWVVGVACAVLVGIVLWIQGRSLAANAACGRAVDSAQKNPGHAYDQARRAVTLAPKNAHYWGTLADITVNLRRFEEAIGYYECAIARDPYRAAYHSRLGRAEIAAHGLSRKVIQEFSTAVDLNPTNQRYRQELREAQESVRQSGADLLGSAPTKKE